MKEKNKLKKSYDLKFYENSKIRTTSASIVLKVFFEYYKPSSIVDVGCGLGHWLSVAKNQFRINKIFGIDGNYVDEKKLLINKEEFLRHDLEKPLLLNDEYDLCISIETAEHLSPEKASQFIKLLTSLADIVLFSAAPPLQGGIHHVNENTPEYWAKLFKEQGFVCFDFMRDLLWDIDEVNCIYPQNLLVFACLEKKIIFERSRLEPTEKPVLKYHPRFVELKLKTKKKSRLSKIKKMITG